MNSVEVFSSTYARVSYLEEYNTIMVVWTGVHTIEEYKKAINASFEFQERLKLSIENYISDIRDQGIVNPESRRWFESTAIPKAIDQGLKRAAVVFDGSVFKKYYLNMILQVANAYHLPFKFFSTHEEAFEWFLSFEN